jgi:hypothetical protein
MVNENAAVKLLFLFYLSPINSEKEAFLKLFKFIWALWFTFLFEVASQIVLLLKRFFFF